MLDPVVASMLCFQEVEKEVVEEEGNRKGKRRKVFETEYHYDAAMEGEKTCSLTLHISRAVKCNHLEPTLSKLSPPLFCGQFWTAPHTCDLLSLDPNMHPHAARNTTQPQPRCRRFVSRRWKGTARHAVLGQHINLFPVGVA